MPSFAFMPSASLSSTSQRNITVDDSDAAVTYSAGWTKRSSAKAVGGSFAAATNVGEIVEFVLPANATAVYYSGFKQPGGAVFGVCVDCNAKGNGTLQTIDAHDTVNFDAPSILFSQTGLDPNAMHTLSVVNFPDKRFGNEGTASVDSFIVSVHDQNAADWAVTQAKPLADVATSVSSASEKVTFVPTATSTPISETPSSSAASLTSSSAIQVSSGASANNSSGIARHDNGALSTSTKPSLLKEPVALAGLLVGTLLILSTVVMALMYFMRRRKRRRNAPGARIQQYVLPPSEPMPPRPRPQSMLEQFSSPPPPVPQMQQLSGGPGIMTVPGMASKAQFFAGVRSPPGLYGAKSGNGQDQNPFGDNNAYEAYGAQSPETVGRQQQGFAPLMPASGPSAPFATSPEPLMSPPRAAGRPETEYIENPFVAAEVEARTRQLIAQRSLRQLQQQQHGTHHQSQSLDDIYDLYKSESGSPEPEWKRVPPRPMSMATVAEPLPLPNVHSIKRKNTWELV